MSVLIRSGLSLLAALILFAAASPQSYAQTRSYSQVFQLDTDGGYLGIQMEDVTADDVNKHKLKSEKGVIVRSVRRGSPAAEAGLQEDDVIVEYSGFQVWSSTQFSRLVRETPPGRKVELAIVRGGEPLTLTARVEGRSASSDDNRIEVFPRDLFRQFELAPFGRSRSDDRDEERPRLGVTLQPLTEQFADYLGIPGREGVLVVAVTKGSPSDGKLAAGDVIVSADGRNIRNPEDLMRLVSRKSGGDLVIKIIRDKKELSVTVRLPASGDDPGRGIKL